MLSVMVESVLFLLLVLAILLIANPIQAKPVEDQRISTNASSVITPNVQTLPRTFILDSSLLANADQAVRNNSTILQTSLKQLIIQADLFLTKKATSVVEKLGYRQMVISMIIFHYQHIIGRTRQNQMACLTSSMMA